VNSQFDSGQTSLRDWLLDFGLLKKFVREDLGCGCPEEVFEDLIVGVPAVFRRDDPAFLLEVLVGGRLFIGVTKQGEEAFQESEIQDLLLAGKEIRDRHGLNRFRLAILSSSVDSAIELPVDEYTGIDDKIHLHRLPDSP